MKRSAPLRRSGRLRRRVPCGRAATRRRLSGSPRAIGRRSVSRQAWEALCVALFTRENGMCQAPGCDAYGLDPHHVVKRSAGGGDDLDNLVLLCRRHHDQTDAAYQDGRLVVQALGEQRFAFAVVTKADKWAPPFFAEDQSSGVGGNIVPNRIIRESCRTSATLFRLSHGAERLFWRMVTIADDYGRFEADPRVLASLCFPLWSGKITPTQVERWYGEMEAAELVGSYVADGKKLGHFLTWERHQRVRAKESKYPAPSSDNACRHVTPHVAVVVVENREAESEAEAEHSPLLNGAARPAPPVFRVDPSILAAIERTHTIRKSERVRKPEYWQAIIRAYPGVDYCHEIADAEAYLQAHPHYKDFADFLRGSIQRAHKRVAS